jgi:FKBP-type peptidyl-prolyl cis-trans isomerase
MRSSANRFLGLFAPVVLLGLAGCTKDAPPTTTSPGTEASGTAGSDGTSAVPSGVPKTGSLQALGTEDVKVGTGRAAQVGDTISVTYTGKLKNGTTFDTNDKPDGKPFRFKLGAGSVIKGWDQGLVGVKQGGERKLAIPASLGYGSKDQAKIPANSDLYFDVKVITVITPEDLTQVTRSTLKVGTGPALKPGDTATVNYTLAGEDGSIMDDKYAKTPYSFKLGAHHVLAVIEAGMVGMKAGGHIKLKIPQMLGPHGPQYAGDATYTADIKLLKITP